MSYSRYWCPTHIVLFFVFFIFLRLVASLDCTFLIATLVCSNVYLQTKYHEGLKNGILGLYCLKFGMAQGKDDIYWIWTGK
jgi:hypothetical protein